MHHANLYKSLLSYNCMQSPSIPKNRIESTALLADNKETLLYMHAQEAELSTLRKLYKATQAGTVGVATCGIHPLMTEKLTLTDFICAELAGTRNRCNKLTEKLSEADEKCMQCMLSLSM